VGVRQHQDELVAAVAGDLVVRAELSAPDGRGLPQDVVAGRMAPAIVDLLEVVEADEDARQALAVAARTLDLVLELFEHRAMVEGTGQRIDARGVPSSDQRKDRCRCLDERHGDLRLRPPSARGGAA
jgi:hypothetical protein